MAHQCLCEAMLTYAWKSRHLVGVWSYGCLCLVAYTRLRHKRQTMTLVGHWNLLTHTVLYGRVAEPGTEERSVLASYFTCVEIKTVLIPCRWLRIFDESSGRSVRSSKFKLNADNNNKLRYVLKTKRNRGTIFWDSPDQHLTETTEWPNFANRPRLATLDH